MPIFSYQPKLRKSDWKRALVEFISARVDLISLEARSFGQIVARKVIAAAAALFFVAFLWPLLLVGLIGWISEASGMAWYWVTLLVALAHLIAAGIAVMALRRPLLMALFSLTRNELTKDREWLRTLKNRRKN